MELDDTPEPTPSSPTELTVLWSNTNARTSEKPTRRARRNRQKLRKNAGSLQPSPQDQPSNDINPSTQTNNNITSLTTIPEITLTTATPGRSSALPPLTTSNTATGHLKPPPFIPRARRTPRLRAKANPLAQPKHHLTADEARQRSGAFDRLHKQLCHDLKYPRKKERYASDVSNDPSLGPDDPAPDLAKAGAYVKSSRAAIEQLFYFRHLRSMTEKDKVQSERLAELHHKRHEWNLYERGFRKEWTIARNLMDTDPEADFKALRLSLIEINRVERERTALLKEISEIEKEMGFGERDKRIPADPANGIFTTEMLRESKWSRKEKLACAEHYVARWEADLQKCEETASFTGGVHWSQEIMEDSIRKAEHFVKYFRSKMVEYSDPGWEERKGMIGGDDKMKGELHTPPEMDERMNELIEGVKSL